MRIGIRHFYSGILVFACHCTVQSAVLQNDAYEVVVTDLSVLVKEKASGANQWFTPSFCLLFSDTGPEISLRKLENGTRYNVPSWKVAPDRQSMGSVQKNSATDPDSFAVGDGFDPDLLAAGKDGRTDNLFHVAQVTDLNADNVVVSGNSLRWSFPDHDAFSFSATLTLASSNELPCLTFSLIPKKNGFYSVGYLGAPSSSMHNADEIWQPLIWQEKRFPEESYLTPAYLCPVPTSFVTHDCTTVGVVADPSEYPFDPLPLFDNSRFGVAVHDAEGNARPMLFAPMLGGVESYRSEGNAYEFSMRLFVSEGGVSDALEKVARDLYGFTDYRENAVGSLNRTLDRMIDYAMSDWSLFSEKDKGCSYSTDAPGAVKNVSSIDPLDLAIVTDNCEMFERRAYPYLEYMLSRGKFLFTTDESQKNQFPSYRLNGPAARVSELSALHQMFGAPVFKALAEGEFQRDRVRNLDVLEQGDSWWSALAMYRATGELRYLDAACNGADGYIENRVETAQTDFNDEDGGGFFFWAGYVPRYIDLFLLYEVTGEQRYLDAAHEGARQYAQFVWFSPKIPSQDILVNEGGKAPEYWYLLKKGHKPVVLSEETVPAWRLSSQGLTSESSGTCWGHRAIFMANYAPWMRRIGYLCNDPFLMDISRSAVIGRYRNFPGYHINTARTTAYEKEDFPLRGHLDQNVTSFHYNHIFPMISMLIDYLVTDAYVRSDGLIDFPARFSEGYAYLQNKAYGGSYGRFFNHQDARLWMSPELLAVPDDVNYITATGSNSLYIALMNESRDAVRSQVSINKEILPQVAHASFSVQVIRNGQAVETPWVMNDGQVSIDLAPRELVGLVVKGLSVSTKISMNNTSRFWKSDLTDLTPVPGRAMVLNLGGLGQTAYVFLEYSKHDFSSVELVRTGLQGREVFRDQEFPWEFTVPLASDETAFDFVLNGIRDDGTIQRIEPVAPLVKDAF